MPTMVTQLYNNVCVRLPK